MDARVNIWYTRDMNVTAKRVKAVLFDLDGTLVDTIGGIAYALNTVLASLGIAKIEDATCMRFVGNGLRNTLKGALQAAGSDVDEAETDRLFALFLDAYARKPFERSVLYPHMPALLQKCVAAGLPVGILSNKDDALVRVIVKALLPDIAFAFVRGALPGEPLKPAADSALRFARMIGLDSADILLVGDSEVDAMTAKAAHMQLALVGWGYRPLQALAQVGYGSLCRTVEELQAEVFA